MAFLKDKIVTSCFKRMLDKEFILKYKLQIFRQTNIYIFS